MTAKESLPSPANDLPTTGSLLRQYRQESNLSLEDVVEATKISRSNLQAIESMDFPKLPADIFARAMVTQYANFLGAEGPLIARQFFRARDGEKTLPRPINQSLDSRAFAPITLAEPAHISSATIAGIILLLIVLSFSGFCLYTSWNPFAFLTENTKKLTSSVVSTFHPADPASSNGKPQAPLTVDVRFLKDAQVSVSLDNGETVQHLFERDKTIRWIADKQARMVFLQADSAEITVNGAAVPFPLAKDGQHILDLPLPPQ